MNLGAYYELYHRMKMCETVLVNKNLVTVVTVVISIIYSKTAGKHDDVTHIQGLQGKY